MGRNGKVDYEGPEAAWGQECQSQTGSAPQPRLREVETLAQIQDSYELSVAQVRLAMRRFLEQDPIARLGVFCSWLREAAVDLPSHYAALAYLNGAEAVTRLADELETLRGAWFPNDAISGRIREIEEELKAVLV